MNAHSVARRYHGTKVRANAAPNDSALQVRLEITGRSNSPLPFATEAGSAEAAAPNDRRAPIPAMETHRPSQRTAAQTTEQAASAVGKTIALRVRGSMRAAIHNPRMGAAAAGH